MFAALPCAAILTDDEESGTRARAGGRRCLRAGDILIDAHGDFSPHALPHDRNAPVVLRGGGRISTVSGGLPPRLETISIEFDRHGSVVTTGLQTCSVPR